MTELARFLQFLVDESAISRQEAQDLQERFPLFIGLLAVKRGYLSYSKVSEILIQQEECAGSFGEIALRDGCLNQEQLETVLDDQKSQSDMIVRVLVGENRMSQDRADRLLDMFHGRAAQAR